MSSKTESLKLITAQEVASLLNCSRANIDRLQLKGDLKPVETIYPKYYFNKKEVLKLKEKWTSKKAVL